MTEVLSLLRKNPILALVARIARRALGRGDGTLFVGSMLLVSDGLPVRRHTMVVGVGADGRWTVEPAREGRDVHGRL